MRATDEAGASATIDVVIEVEPHRYDLNHNGAFEKGEIIEAISDYFDGLLSKNDVIEMVRMYFVESG